MKKYLLALLLTAFILYFSGLWADFVLLFKYENGRTNWQYVANWMSSFLILMLSVTAVFLYLSRKEKDRANQELEAVKVGLEVRVKERTATLDESNRLLKQEIEKHIETARQLNQSERYIQSILKFMPSMLVGLNAKGEITQWNEKAEKYTGVSAQNALGKYLWDAYPIITIKPELVEKALAQKNMVTLRQSQRGMFHFDITIYPLHDTEQQGVVLLIDDVTHQVKSENKLIQKDRLSSMGELASSLAHDMSIPLQGMLSDVKQIEAKVSLLSNKVENLEDTSIFSEIAAINHELSDAHAQGKVAMAMVGHLLDFAASGRVKKRAADVAEIMEHSLELARDILPLPQGMSFDQITIKKDFEPNISKLHCFTLEIQQVFFSLLRHCFHALAQAKDEPCVTIKILECYDAIWVKISHNGAGLTIQEQQSIFEPYFSSEPLDSENDADKRLSFSHFIVTEQHKGQMAVTSDPRIGTTFHMQFQLN